VAGSTSHNPIGLHGLVLPLVVAVVIVPVVVLREYDLFVFDKMTGDAGRKSLRIADLAERLK
jgi:hypothetical protein